MMRNRPRCAGTQQLRGIDRWNRPRPHRLERRRQLRRPGVRPERAELRPEQFMVKIGEHGRDDGARVKQCAEQCTENMTSEKMNPLMLQRYDASIRLP